MEKTRVPKGEKYWYISLITGYGENGISIDWDNDEYWRLDNLKWAEGNYFHTKEEAESMANKLRAVLKGAEVIEIPSEEEIENKVCDTKERIYRGESSEYKGLHELVNWLKSKIVK